jgi:hypothetical protein
MSFAPFLAGAEVARIRLADTNGSLSVLVMCLVTQLDLVAVQLKLISLNGNLIDSDVDLQEALTLRAERMTGARIASGPFS